MKRIPWHCEEVIHPRVFIHVTADEDDIKKFAIRPLFDTVVPLNQ